MLRFFRVYQFVVPAILFPVSYYLWFVHYDRDHRLALLALSIPVVYAYVIPGIGTNWLRLYDFNTRWKLGAYRPHHGFVFGTATSLLALFCLPRPAGGPEAVEILRAGFVLGSVLAFWNWLYDIYAIKSGFMVVYNKPWVERLGPEAIATEYAPALFGTFGACYGAALRASEYLLVDRDRADLFWWCLLASHLAVLLIPGVAYVVHSYVRSGETGLRPHKGG